MGWIIAILLALILVAMMSSNKEAANGVFKAINISIFLLCLTIPWLIYITWSFWYAFNNTDNGDWAHYIGIGCALLLPPLLAWINRHYLIKVYKEDRKSAYKLIAKITILVSILFVSGVTYHHLKIEYPDIGWTILICGLLITGFIHITKQSNSGKSWKEIFFTNPYEAPWDRAYKEIEPLEIKNEKEYKEALDNWAKFTNEEQIAIDEKYSKTVLDLENKHRQLAEKYNKESNRNYIEQAFWWFLIFTFFGLIKILWNVAFDFAITLNFVKNREWMAHGVVLIAFIAVASGIFNVLSELDKKKS